MHKIRCLMAFAAVGAATAGCSQITVTSHTLVDGTARIADATTDAARSTSNATTDASHNAFAQNHSARRRFVDSEYALLKNQAARGQGEDLDALAYMMRAKDRQAFASVVQAHYAELFAGKPTADAFLARLYDIVGRPADMAMSDQPSRIAAS